MPPLASKGKALNSAKALTMVKPPAHQTAPSWPTLKPLLPSSDLSLEIIVPGQVITISQFWTASLCKTYVNFLSGLPLTTTPGKPKRGDAVRVNDRFQVDDEAFAQRLWTETGLIDLILGDAAGRTVEERQCLWGGDVMGLNPNIRVYRYSKGQFFDQHYDDFNDVVLGGKRSRTTWTLLLYLTSPATGCIGGETVFYPDPPKGSRKKGAVMEPLVAELEVGKLLLHKHGKDCMLHEGREVLKGEKWVLRTDLCVSR